jgi:hypothetical protein
MNKKDCVWEDGTEFILEVGQIWVPQDANDYTLEIVGITNTEVTFKQLENGEIWPHEFDGPDGFVDYLENLFYTLKK